MQAIIQSGGKQYRVGVGDIIRVERLGPEEGKKVTFPVLALEDGEKMHVGRPHLEAAHVAGEILSNDKGKKILVYKVKRRKKYRKIHGHRQLLTKVRITEIKEK